MSLVASKARLIAVSQQLSLQWAETKNYWRDAKAREFEQRFIQELGAEVDRTATVIDKLNELLNKVRNDCE